MSEIQNEVLLPCPHCGGQAQFDTDTEYDSQGKRTGVECLSCPVTMLAHNRQSAAKWWNARHNTDHLAEVAALRAEVERLREWQARARAAVSNTRLDGGQGAVYRLTKLILCVDEYLLGLPMSEIEGQAHPTATGDGGKT